MQWAGERYIAQATYSKLQTEHLKELIEQRPLVSVNNAGWNCYAAGLDIKP
jgi:hypothetical protein